MAGGPPDRVTYGMRKDQSDLEMTKTDLEVSLAVVVVVCAGWCKKYNIG